MKNLIFIACALCAVAAVPLPAAENSDLEVLQIPLEGNKVSIILIRGTNFIVLHLKRQNIRQVPHRQKKKYN